MLYSRNTDHIYKKIKKNEQTNLILIPGVAGAGLEGFSGDPRESSSGRSCRSRVASARSARMRATSGKSLFTETLYVAQIIRYVIVSGIASEPACMNFDQEFVLVRRVPRRVFSASVRHDARPCRV